MWSQIYSKKLWLCARHAFGRRANKMLTSHLSTGPQTHRFLPSLQRSSWALRADASGCHSRRHLQHKHPQGIQAVWKSFSLFTPRRFSSDEHGELHSRKYKTPKKRILKFIRYIQYAYVLTGDWAETPNQRCDKIVACFKDHPQMHGLEKVAESSLNILFSNQQGYKIWNATHCRNLNFVHPSPVDLTNAVTS